MTPTRLSSSGPVWRERTGRLGLAGLLVLLIASVAASAASRPPQAAPNRRDYSSFKIITDRNIFNASRSRRPDRNTSEDRRPARAQTFTLVGTMSYEKGFYAFFDGSSSEFRKALEPGKSIAGHKLVEVSNDGVQLAAGTNQFDLKVGMQMRREDEGDWTVVASSAPPTTAASASSSAAPDDENDIIKKLMQQREQELK